MWWLAYSLTDRRKIGGVHVQSQYEAARKPGWLLALKLSGVAVMLGLGYFLLAPLFPLPGWQAAVLATGVMLVYVGIAFFVRPEPNTDDLGWFGGLMDDPFSFSDGINRWLWSLHCCLGPGRFVAETLLDTCAALGVIAPEEAGPSGESSETAASSDADRAIRERPAHGGFQELSSARFLTRDLDAE